MAKALPEVDAYIEAAAPFARPILTRLRAIVHEGAPGIHEEIKWRCPCFVGKKIVAGMAAFKEHVTFGFWRAKELSDPEKLFRGDLKAGMHDIKITSLADLPTKKVLVAYVKEAAALDAQAGPAAKKKAVRRPDLEAPADLLAALKKAKKARVTFESFSPSQQREYVEWIVSAKREETRSRRIAQAVEWMAEGKSRNWKYR